MYKKIVQMTVLFNFTIIFLFNCSLLIFCFITLKFKKLFSTLIKDFRVPPIRPHYFLKRYYQFALDFSSKSIFLLDPFTLLFPKE